jgi:hypothetical protein
MLAGIRLGTMGFPAAGMTGCMIQTASFQAQVRRLHTRDLTRLSHVQVADYLKRSDIIVPDARSKALYGAHYIAGRIFDLPLPGDYGEGESKAAGPVPENIGLAGLSKFGIAAARLWARNIERSCRARTEHDWRDDGQPD